MRYPHHASKIIKLKQKDLAFRDQLIASGKLHDGYNQEMESIHIENAETLDAIIDQIGYPTIEKVGKEASEAAWLVIQHAISRPAFMRKCAQLLEVEVSNNNADPIPHAYLQDRIAVLEGENQLYGTQFDWDENGQMSPNTYDDIDKVNQRRQALGLNTLEEQTELIRARIKKENQKPPKDYKLRQKEMEEWRKRNKIQ